MTAFDIATVEADYAGPGRTLEGWSEDVQGNFPRYGCRIDLENGWTFSVIWGFGSYSTNARPAVAEYVEHPRPWSRDAEVMPGNPGRWTPEVDCSTVAGYVTEPQFRAALVAAERDDAYGVIYHLSQVGVRS